MKCVGLPKTLGYFDQRHQCNLKQKESRFEIVAFSIPFFLKSQRNLFKSIRAANSASPCLCGKKYREANSESPGKNRAANLRASVPLWQKKSRNDLSTSVLKKLFRQFFLQQLFQLFGADCRLHFSFHNKRNFAGLLGNDDRDRV